MAKKRTTSVSKGMTFKQGRDLVFRVKKLEGCSPRTIENYNKVFNDFQQCFGGRKHINNVTVDDARKFIEWQLNEKVQFLNARGRRERKIGVSVVSANTYLGFAKGAFEVFVQDGIIETNPFRPLKKIKEQERKVDTLTPLEIKEILKALDKTWYADFRDFVVIHAMLDTFGRINEICNLQKDDIDYESGAVTFQKTKNNRFRIVPVSSKMLRLIDQLNDETEEFDSPYIFLSNQGKRLHPDTFRKHLREVVAKTTITKRVHPHIFRHTASTLFLAEGGSIRALQKILGHRDISTTMIYGHMLDSTIKDQHERFSPLRSIEMAEQIKTRTRGRK